MQHPGILARPSGQEGPGATPSSRWGCAFGLLPVKVRRVSSKKLSMCCQSGFMAGRGLEFHSAVGQATNELSGLCEAREPSKLTPSPSFLPKWYCCFALGMVSSVGYTVCECCQAMQLPCSLGQRGWELHSATSSCQDRSRPGRSAPTEFPGHTALLSWLRR